MKQTAGNYPAPLRILEAVRNGIVNGPSEGYKFESQVFFVCKFNFVIFFFVFEFEVFLKVGESGYRVIASYAFLCLKQ